MDATLPLLATFVKKVSHAILNRWLQG
jgi:hypothetical protein